MKTNRKITGLKFFKWTNDILLGLMLFQLAMKISWYKNLVEKWSLPEEPFFLKINLENSINELSMTTYFIFATLYLLLFFVVFVGFFHMHRITRYFSRRKIFIKEISSLFFKAGVSFLVFSFGTLLIDITFLILTDATDSSSEAFRNIFAIDEIAFILIGFLLLFLSGIFREGVFLQEELEYTV